MKKYMKSRSKRVSCRKKYKIIKKVKEHHRKLRKTLKAEGHKPKKDPGIPTGMPFTKEIIKENIEMKAKEEAEKERRKKLLRDLKAAAKRSEKFEKNNKRNHDEAFGKDMAPKMVENSRAFYKEFSRVLSSANVILEVLDARDPIGSRCIEVEEEVVKAGKKLVLILNKIDLVPRDVVLGWLTHLRQQFPAIAFKANTSQQRSRTKAGVVTATAGAKSGEEIAPVSRRCLGLDTLMKLLHGYANEGASVVAGVIGLPNTGKSSLINSLNRSRSCDVGPMPGMTRHIQEISVEKQVKLIDCPGVVISRRGDPAEQILRNCVRLDSVEDPEIAVSAILRRCSPAAIRLKFGLPAEAVAGDTNAFLVALARRFGRFKKGGVPDTKRAARNVIEEWVRGNITYYTMPPETDTSAATANEAKVVTELAPSFIDDLNAKVLEKIGNTKSPLDLIISKSQPAHLRTQEEDDEKEMDADNSGSDDDDEEEDDKEMMEEESEREENDEEEENAEDMEDESDNEDPVPSKKRKGALLTEVIKKQDFMKGMCLNKEIKKMQAKELKRKRKRASRGLD